jgi:hypothetical protein
MGKINSDLRGRNLKREVFALLISEDFDQALKALCAFPARRVINPLFSFLCSTEPQTRWRAVLALGLVVSSHANEDMESARVIMRRIIWNLNDESGGIGWGLPETMGEIMARHEGLAREYANILMSYIQEDGNFLEHPPLQQGVLWGLWRLAQSRPQLLRAALLNLHPFLTSDDATLRALAVLILGLSGSRECDSELESLLEDEAKVTIFFNGRQQDFRVKELAKQVLPADV